jgi:hypothetical protein
MRFDFQQNVLCLADKHPLLWECSRGWTPKNHIPAREGPQRPQPENGGAETAVEPDDLSRFEGEGGAEVYAPATELMDVPLENAIWRRSAAP